MTGTVPVRTRMAAGAGRAVGGLSRLVGAGSGGVIGGRVSLAIDPDALAELARGRRTALVSGTNGKTTTTSLLAAALGTLGPVASNQGGANLPYGLVAALSRAPVGAPAALEVDEAYLGRVAEAVQPAAVCLLNLSRDQLDRINEVRMLASRWREAVARLGRSGPVGEDPVGEDPVGEGPVVVANADDPMVVWAAGAAARPVWVAGGLSWRLDATGCPSCGGRIDFGAGDWACDCGFTRPRPDVWLGEDGSVVRSDGRRVPLHLSLPGRCNRANAAVALVAAEVLGVPPQAAADAMGRVVEVMGRYSVATISGVPARLLLAKNPAGWAEVFDFLTPPPAPVVVAINARVADGSDPSWLWDVPFERLAGRRVVATGERCRDLAVRLRYAQVDHETVEELGPAVVAGGRQRDSHPARAESEPVDVVANYTSFQALRRLAAHGP